MYVTKSGKGKKHPFWAHGLPVDFDVTAEKVHC